jgi:hypothetical protein
MRGPLGGSRLNDSPRRLGTSCLSRSASEAPAGVTQVVFDGIDSVGGYYDLSNSTHGDSLS